MQLLKKSDLFEISAGKNNPKNPLLLLNTNASVQPEVCWGLDPKYIEWAKSMDNNENDD